MLVTVESVSLIRESDCMSLEMLKLERTSLIRCSRGLLAGWGGFLEGVKG